MTNRAVQLRAAILSVWLIPASTFLAFLYPLAILGSGTIAWVAAELAPQERVHAAIAFFALPTLTTGALVAHSLIYPDRDYGWLVGKLALGNLAMALAAYWITLIVIKSRKEP